MQQILIIFICFLCTNIYGQKLIFQENKKKLSELITLTHIGENDSIRVDAHNNFLQLLNHTLSLKKSYLYSFNDIEYLSVLQPKNKKFKIFTWFLPLKNGSVEYFGIIQKCKKNGKKCETYYLQETLDINNNNLYTELQTEDWYGCLYYEIIPVKFGKETYYTLLGWDGNDAITTKKIIDVLYIPKKKHPVFGADIFKNTQYRMVIEYSSQYPISLKYDKDLEYIVFDHLEPMDGMSTNNFSIYATNLSYDILKKTENGWELEENIYLNNTK